MTSCAYCYESTKNCRCVFRECSVCHKDFPEDQMYESRGSYGCEKDIERVRTDAEAMRSVDIREANDEVAFADGLDFGAGPIGRANREIFQSDITRLKRKHNS